MKVIIAGGRDFTDYAFLKRNCDAVLFEKTGITVISGTAGGADTMGEKYAREKHYAIKQFPAFWDIYGKSAGYKRNSQMADYADVLIAFWDGQSKGTKHMIDLAKSKNMDVYVITYKSCPKDKERKLSPVKTNI